MNSLAIEDGKNIIIVSDDVEYTIPRDDYDYVKECFRTGVAYEDLSPVIRPSDIIGYLEEANPEAEMTASEAELSIAERKVKKDQALVVLVGFAAFLVLVGIGALYFFLTQDAGTASAAANTAASAPAMSIS